MNPKIIGIAAGVGFVLSILIGLIAQNSIIAIFLRGFICAVVCAGMSAGIMFIFGKYDFDKQNAKKQSRYSNLESTTRSAFVGCVTFYKCYA